MDGSTWHRYRFVTERGSEPPFFLEPENPDDAPQHFRDARFAPLAHFVSALDSGLQVRDADAAAAEVRLASVGVCIRPVRAERFADDARAIFHVSLAAFRDNFLYSPIDEAEFLEMYVLVEQFVDPKIAFIAEAGGEAVGFVFALPDWSSATSAPRTMIVKTLARLRDPALSGLGAVLLERCRRGAFERGYVRGIHALMHDTNASVGLSARFGSIIRGYTLFARPL